MARTHKFLKTAIKHPGIEKQRAKEHGISTHEQLERDAKSDNPTLRGRGNLGLRFEKGGDLHHSKKASNRYSPKHITRD